MRIDYGGGVIVGGRVWLPKKCAADRAKNVPRRRRKLVRKLGGKCARCGSRQDLEFHHKETRTWVAAETSRWRRIKRYEEEAAAGLLELLCSKCNKKAGKPVDPDDVPF